MSEWISVKDRLPECPHEYTADDTMVSQSVLVCDANDQPSLGMAHMVENGSWTLYGGDHDFMHPETITHWMPLPNVPDKESNK